MKTQQNLSNIRTTWLMSLLVVVMAALTACNTESRGFVLPDGDVEKGKQLFTDLNCIRCHSIADIDWEGVEQDGDPHIELGGEVTAMKSYGELVTSVINPSHKINRHFLPEEKVTLTEGMSKMELYRYNEIMTVEELVNIVTFLQSEYELMKPEYPIPYARY